MEDSWILNRWFNSDDRYLGENELVLISNLLLAKNIGDQLGYLQFDRLNFEFPIVLKQFVPVILETIIKLKQEGIELDDMSLPDHYSKDEIKDIEFLKDFTEELWCALMHFNEGINCNEKLLLLKQEVCEELYNFNEDVQLYGDKFITYLKDLEFHFKVEDIQLVWSIQADLKTKFDTYLSSFKERTLKAKGDTVIYSNSMHEKLFEAVLKEAVDQQGNQNIRLNFNKQEYFIENISLKRERFRFIEYAWVIQEEEKLRLLSFENTYNFLVDIETTVETNLNDKFKEFEVLNVFDSEFKYLRIFKKNSGIETLVFSETSSLALKYVHKRNTLNQIPTSQYEIANEVGISCYTSLFKNGNDRYATSLFIKSKKQNCHLIRPYAVQNGEKIEFFK